MKKWNIGVEYIPQCNDMNCRTTTTFQYKKKNIIENDEEIKTKMMIFNRKTFRVCDGK